MKIAENCVVSIHYTLTDEAGSVIDSSEGAQPLNYLSGAGNIILGLDRALMGLSAGDKTQVVVQPEEGYGEFDPSLLQTLPHEAFGGIDNIEAGMEFQSETPDGHVQYVVVKDVDANGVTIDANHMLAGKVLHFAVSIEAVRAADATEIAHGHVH